MSTPSDELLEIRELTRAFTTAELRPHTELWEQQGALSEELMAQLAELGFLGMIAPEAHGGMALGVPTWLAALAELAAGDASAALALALHGHVVQALAGGSAAAQAELLAALAAGSVIGCASLTPEAGTCRAEPRDGGWQLDGVVPWVGNIRPGGVLLVQATSTAGALAGLVPLDTPGVTVRREARTLGLTALALSTVELRNAALPESAVLPAAPDPAGLSLAVAAVAVGVARGALAHARAYADQREQFGCKLRVFEGMQYKLADMATRTAAAAALLAEAGVAGDAGAAAMSKLQAAETALYVTTQAVQVFGGYGYMRDYPVERLMRDARAMSLAGGADDLQRLRIAAALYRE